MPNGPLASLFWRFTDAINYWTFQLQLCILDAICGPERTRFIAGPAWQPAGCAQSALCRAAPGALQSCNNRSDQKKTQLHKFYPEFGSQSCSDDFTWPQRRSGHCLCPGFRIASRAAAAALGNACVRTMPENLDAGRDG
jgi:hypothetical protein